MLSKILTRTRWKLFAHKQHIVVKYGEREKFTHPLMKAFLWALYLPQYPTATIEVSIGDRYKPDVIAMPTQEDIFRVQTQPLFWGEAGQTGKDKIQSIVKRFPNTHFALAKWDSRLKPYEDIIAPILKGAKRNAPFDLLNFPEGSEAFVDEDGNITIRFEDIEKISL